jgi:hypothetical protein
MALFDNHKHKKKIKNVHDNIMRHEVHYELN